MYKDRGGSALKVDIIKDAYSQLRISGLTVNPTPEDLEVALSRLESMAAEWDSRNIATGYNFEDEPDPNTEIGVNRAYWQCFSTNLAVRLIPDFNKAVPQVLMMQAQQALSNLSGRSAMNRINGVDYPSRQPVGSGNSRGWNRWNRFYRIQAQAPNDSATNIMTVGDINDYVEHFDAYLNEGETIASFIITTDPALTLESSSNTDNDVLYRVKAGSGTNTASLAAQALIIIATTSEGRVETRSIVFNVEPANA